MSNEFVVRNNEMKYWAQFFGNDFFCTECRRILWVRYSQWNKSLLVQVFASVRNFCEGWSNKIVTKKILRKYIGKNFGQVFLHNIFDQFWRHFDIILLICLIIRIYYVQICVRNAVTYYYAKIIQLQVQTK